MKERIAPRTPFNYRNQLLMEELNDMMMRIKAHLFDRPKLKDHFPKPTNGELDALQNKLMQVLKKDKELMIKY